MEQFHDYFKIYSRNASGNYSQSNISKELEVKVWTVIPGIIIVTGTIGNSLSIAAVTNNYCKKTSFTIYLAALAITDTLVLYTSGISLWLRKAYDINISLFGVPGCKLNTYFNYLFPQISSWLVVAITVERMLCTYYPSKTQLVNNHRTGIKVVATLITFIVLLNSNLLFGFTYIFHDALNQSICDITDANYSEFYLHYWSWIHLTAYALLPFAIIISANVATVLKVFRSGMILKLATKSSRTRYLLLVTFLVSVTFLILAMPLSLSIAITPANHHTFLGMDEVLTDIVVFNMMLLNHAVNFFLYILTGSRFRRDLRAAFCTPDNKTN